MANSENRPALYKHKDELDDKSHTATAKTDCQSLDVNDFTTNNSINTTSDCSSNNNNNNNNNSNLSDACISSTNNIIVSTSRSEAKYVSTPLRPGLRNSISIHRAPGSKTRMQMASYINNCNNNNSSSNSNSSIRSSNLIHITNPEDAAVSVCKPRVGKDDSNKYNNPDDGGDNNEEASTTLHTNTNIGETNSGQNNNPEDCANVNKSNDDNNSGQESVVSQQKQTETDSDDRCPANTDVQNDSTLDVSSELNTEPNSVNTSQNYESSSGLDSSLEQPQKQETVNFTDPKQRQVFEALTGIQSLRKDGQFSDVIIRVKDQEFRCHRFILSKSSPVFCAMINNAMANGDSAQGDEGTQYQDSSIDAKDTQPAKTTACGTPVVLVVNGVEAHILDKVLDYMYCVFDDVLTESTTLDLLLAAETFQLANLSQTCVEYIADTVSVANVFEIVRLLDSGGCASLDDVKVRTKCHQVLRKNFLHLCYKNEFLCLNRHRMITLVADSMLAIKNEMDLIQPLIRWVSVRPSERCADLTLMLQLIRFPLMAPEDLDKLMDIPFLKENSLAIALVDESKAYGLKDFPERMAWPRQNCFSRCQFPSRDFILWTADRNKGLHLYSIIDGLHYKVTTFNEATEANAEFTFDSTSTVCCYGNRLFFTGGEFNTDIAWSVDSGTGEVSTHAKMPRGRKFHSMVASRGCIYCLGGQDKRGYTVLDTVDAFIISKGLWLKVGHMAVAAYNMTAVTSNGAIYLIGGVDHSGQPLRLIQCFTVLRSGLYSAFKVDISNMPPSLLSSRAVTSGLEESVYIVCGHGEVYHLDIEKKVLHHVNTLKSLSQNPRVRFGLAHVGGVLVVTGGHQLGHMMQEAVRSVCMDIVTKTELKDYSPLLPADMVNTCFYAKLSSGILEFSKLSTPSQRN